MCGLTHLQKYLRFQGNLINLLHTPRVHNYQARYCIFQSVITFYGKIWTFSVAEEESTIKQLAEHCITSTLARYILLLQGKETLDSNWQHSGH